MKRLVLFLSAMLPLSVSPVSYAEVTVDFEELNPPTETENEGGTGSYFDGYGSEAETGTWTSQDTSFNTNEFGPGWSYSNVVDTTTPGFENMFASFTGGGSDALGNTVEGGNYAIGNGNGAFVNLPEMMRVESTRVTNTTYAALSMQDGDAFATKFSSENDDFFSVTFQGWSEQDASGSVVGEVEFFLADFRDDNELIVDSWESLDLSELGTARSIGLEFASSDVGEFGINTPMYVAVDNLQITAVPEPAMVMALAALALGITAVEVRRRRRWSAHHDRA